MNFMTLARECAPMADPQTLMAIVRVESGFRPYAIGVNGKNRLTRQPRTRKEAIAVATGLIGKGFSIDLGLAQINSANLPVLGLSVTDAFDPCKNINAAARLFQSDYRRALAAGYAGNGALVATLSAYNTGSFTRGVHNGYVKKVLAAYSGSQKISLSLKGSSPKDDAVSPGVMVYAAGSSHHLIFQP